jgi:phage virion morphogenesis protein
MAGATLHIDIDAKPLQAQLEALAERAGSLEPVFSDFGEYLLNRHRARFAQQVSPDGEAWAPLSPRYKARKPKNKNKLLVLEGHLRGLLRYQTGPAGLEFGTSLVYGAVHQFGHEEIPARPYLGLDAADEAELGTLIQEHLAEAATG